MNNRKPLIVNFYCDTDIVHTSYVAAGLKELEKEGIVKLKYKIGTGKAKGRNGLLFSQCISIPEQNKTIVFDMHDQSDYFFPDYFENENIEYYKANFDPKQISELKRDIKPFVPYFPIKYRSIHWKQILGYYLVIFGKNKSSKVPLLKNLKLSAYSTLSRIKRLKQRGNIGDYFNTKIEHNGILFTPGCWPEKDEYQIKANQERYQLIKALKARFPDAFKGGFPDNQTAKNKYTDAIAEKQNTHKDYISNINSAKINVYTSGLNNCVSWRLGELISTGSFIVGPKLPYEFHNKSLLDNYLTTEKDNITDYVTKCTNLLDDNKMPSKLSADLLNPRNILNQIIFSQ